MKLTWLDILALVGIATSTISSITELANTAKLEIPPIWALTILILSVLGRGIEAWLQRKVANEPSPKQTKREKELLKRAQAAEAQVKALQGIKNAHIEVPAPDAETMPRGKVE